VPKQNRISKRRVSIELINQHFTLPACFLKNIQRWSNQPILPAPCEPPTQKLKSRVWNCINERNALEELEGFVDQFTPILWFVQQPQGTHLSHLLQRRNMIVNYNRIAWVDKCG
jgi:hypothetical protein